VQEAEVALGFGFRHTAMKVSQVEDYRVCVPAQRKLSKQVDEASRFLPQMVSMVWKAMFLLEILICS
jgi:hypothetical protein